MVFSPSVLLTLLEKDTIFMKLFQDAETLFITYLKLPRPLEFFSYR